MKVYLDESKFELLDEISVIGHAYYKLPESFEGYLYVLNICSHDSEYDEWHFGSFTNGEFIAGVSYFNTSPVRDNSIIIDLVEGLI